MWTQQPASDLASFQGFSDYFLFTPHEFPPVDLPGKKVASIEWEEPKAWSRMYWYQRTDMG